VLVGLGDDDPITFASCLPDEFCHMYHALIRRGIAAADALQWLDTLRRNGLRARFTLEASRFKDRKREPPRQVLFLTEVRTARLMPRTGR
jgi:hypothetical protein